VPVIPIAAELTVNLVNAEQQPSKRRLDVSAVLIALITATGVLGTGAMAFFKHEQIDCVSARTNAIKLVKDEPASAVPYEGQYESQCQLNEVVQKVLDAKKP